MVRGRREKGVWAEAAVAREVGCSAYCLLGTGSWVALLADWVGLAVCSRL